jgi:hypothetical protein
LAGEWFDVPRPEAHMGLPSAQSLLTSVLRRASTCRRRSSKRKPPFSKTSPR